MKKMINQAKSLKFSGFTLIELLVVATIIIVLTTIGVVSYQRAAARSRDSKRKADLETVRQALVLYRSEVGEYPSGNFSAVVTSLNEEGFLSEGPSRFQNPGGAPYVYNQGGAGASFTLSVALEDGSTYTLNSP